MRRISCCEGGMADWLLLALDNIPEAAGVYGFQSGETWLYIGKAKNLRSRLNQRHPALQVALSLAIDIGYWYRLSDEHDRLERLLIRELQPQWNGGTSHSELLERHLYDGSGPFCAVALGNGVEFWRGLAELGQLHPDRLAYFSQFEQARILAGLPLFDGYTEVSEEEKRGAIDLL
jgi:hypothetical protein